MVGGRLRAMVLSAAMAALALTLPLAFHLVGLGGQFLPMELPLLLNGFLVPWPWAVGTAFVVPWISAFTTGMPPLYPPVAAEVAAESVVLAAVAGFLWRRTGRKIWLSLIPAVVAGRIVTFFATWAIATFFALPPAVSSIGAVVKSLPGVALQLTVVPLVLRAIAQRRGPLLDDE